MTKEKRFSDPYDSEEYGKEYDSYIERVGAEPEFNDIDDENISAEYLDTYDTDDITASSTMPTPTFDRSKRLDYVKIMEEYNSGDEKRMDKAAEMVIKDLMGLILYTIKKKYSNYARRYYDDLVQCGEIGVLIGLKDYDPSKGLPSTYFSYYIIHEMQDFINSAVYKTTPYYSANIKKINKAIAEFESLGRPYTRRDLSIQTGIPLDTVEKVMNIMNGGSEVSLDAFRDQLAGPDTANPADEYVKREATEYIYTVLHSVLTQEEAQIIMYLFGMGEKAEKLSLKETATRMNISIDRVKKLKIEAFCKLRNSPLSRVYSSRFKNDILELEDEDSVSFFPLHQAINSSEEMKEIEIEF